TFSAICRAPSRLRSRASRGCQTRRVRLIRLSFAACDGFTEDLTAGFSPLRAPGLRSRTPTDDAGPWRDLHLGRPHRRDRCSRAASERQFFIADSELVRVAGTDHKVALAAVADLTNDRIFKEAVLEPIDDERFQTVERFADLPTGDTLQRGCD